MTTRQITIAAVDLDAFRRATILAYGTRAEALAHELGRALGVDADVAKVDACRRRLDAAASVMEQIGWASARRRTAQQVEVERALLEAVVRSMLIDAAEMLSATVASRDASADARERMRVAVDRIGRLLERLEDVGASEVGPPHDDC